MRIAAPDKMFRVVGRCRWEGGLNRVGLRKFRMMKGGKQVEPCVGIVKLESQFERREIGDIGDLRHGC